MSMVFPRPLFELLQVLRTRWQYRGKGPIVVVHQMARVGSRAVSRAVRERLPGVRSFHTHYLNPATLQHMHAQFVRLHEHTGRPGLYREYLQANWLAKRLRRREYGDWRIVSLARDPLARTVSAFFRHLPLNHPELGEAFRDDPANVSELIELFRKEDEFEHGFALDWFDREVRDVFGVDVFDRPYPKDGRGCLYRCDAGTLLVLRTEDLSSGGGAALGSFLDTGPFRLPHDNRSTDLAYAATYRRFLSELRLSSEYLDRMYGSKLARHFYSDAELAAFRSRWTVDA